MSDTYLIPQFIIDYLQKSKSKKNPQKLAPYLTKKNLTPEIEQWFKENEVTARYIWNCFVFYGLNKFSFRECPICGKRLNIKTVLSKPDAKYCSTKCASSSEETKEKYKQTCLEKYGVENPNQRKEVREKIKQTCLERYGVEVSSQSKDVQEKFKQTCLKKYGVEHPFQSKEVQDKIKQTILEKYGVEYSLQSKEIQEKRKETCLEKYGVEYSLQSKDVKEKSRQTWIKKYGVENPNQCKEVREKYKETCKEKYGTECFTQSKKYKETKRSKHWKDFCKQLKDKNIVPIFSKEEYTNDTGRVFKCLICNNEFVTEGVCAYAKEHKSKNGTYKTLQINSIFCPYCFKAHYSKKEKSVLEFVRSIYHGEILENDRTALAEEGKKGNQKELDIYLPSLNLAIEFDGTYWHSSKEAQEKDETKNQLCEQKGITLLRIKESEWDTDRNLVESKISAIISRCEN